MFSFAPREAVARRTWGIGIHVNWSSSSMASVPPQHAAFANKAESHETDHMIKRKEFKRCLSAPPARAPAHCAARVASRAFRSASRASLAMARTTQ
jgi:hypothetical protein